MPWTFEPLSVASLALSLLLYTRGVIALWRHGGRGVHTARWQVASFYAGWGVAAIALVSPIAWLSAIRLTAHMTQHELLMLVAAPLIVFGQPGVMWLRALPPAARNGVAGVIRRPAIKRTWRGVTAPFVVFVVHAVALWVWHLPPLYDAALRNDTVHFVQHLLFTGTAALFWWGMFAGRYGPIGYGAAVAYVFLTALHSSALGALMAISTSPWYATYAAVAAATSGDAAADQQVAGLLMWIPFGTVFMVLGLALMAAWLGERRSGVVLRKT